MKSMEQEMRESGSKIPEIIEALYAAGYVSYQHHDNWIKREDRPTDGSRKDGQSMNYLYDKLNKNE